MVDDEVRKIYLDDQCSHDDHYDDEYLNDEYHDDERRGDEHRGDEYRGDEHRGDGHRGDEHRGDEYHGEFLDDECVQVFFCLELHSDSANRRESYRKSKEDLILSHGLAS